MRILLATILTLVLAEVAYATADGCAVVKKTPDGSLNLRQAPTNSAMTILKLMPGWELDIDTASCENNGSISICAKKMEWTHVTSVLPLNKADSSTKGWVATYFLKFVDL